MQFETIKSEEMDKDAKKNRRGKFVPDDIIELLLIRWIHLLTKATLEQVLSLTGFTKENYIKLPQVLKVQVNSWTTFSRLVSGNAFMGFSK